MTTNLLIYDKNYNKSNFNNTANKRFQVGSEVLLEKQPDPLKVIINPLSAMLYDTRRSK